MTSRRTLFFRCSAFAWLALVALAFIGCDKPCPGDFDPDENPAGDSCVIESDCRVECVCENADGDELGVFTGSCTAPLAGYLIDEVITRPVDLEKKS